MASSAQCAQPCMADLSTESLQCLEVAGDGVVVEVSLNNLPQPSPLFRNRPMTISYQGFAHVLYLFLQTLADGFAVHCESSAFPVSCANVRETEKVENFRLPLTSFLAA